jgi:hypothetical protein
MTPTSAQKIGQAGSLYLVHLLLQNPLHHLPNLPPLRQIWEEDLFDSEDLKDLTVSDTCYKYVPCTFPQYKSLFCDNRQIFDTQVTDDLVSLQQSFTFSDTDDFYAIMDTSKYFILFRAYFYFKAHKNKYFLNF